MQCCHAIYCHNGSQIARAPCAHRNWCPYGVRNACNARVVAAVRGRFDRIIAHGFENRAQ
eukprot:6522968-Lingulodinium_polyedra.AAC.1